MSTHLAVTILGTVLIAAVVYALWKRTRELGFVLGVAALYYWSVYGAFVFISDQAKRIEFPRYEWVLASTFPVALDDHYFLAIVYYCCFVLLTVATVLTLARPARRFEESPRDPGAILRLSPVRLLAAAAITLFLAYYVIRNELLTAALQDVSVYVATRAGVDNQAYSFRMVLHQVLTQVAITMIALGIAVDRSSSNPRHMVARTSPMISASYALASLAMVGFCMLLGRKTELLFGVLFGLVLYLGNHRRPRYSVISGLGVAALLALAIVDAVRGLSMASLLIGQEVGVGDILRSAMRSFSSNESVSAHFSLYGILRWDPPITYGSSIVSLVASIVPRALWHGRPPDIYGYYAEQLGLPTDVGYTIHHAAGWYLNFGPVGIMFGACVLGAFWAALWNLRARATGLNGDFARCFAAVAFAGFTASIPLMIRAGIEGYKGVIALGMAFPALLVWSMTIRRARVPNIAADHPAASYV